MSKHTPGPWRHLGGADAGRVVANDTSDGAIAVVHGVANARLIAAAPDMLEALKNLTSGEVSGVKRSAYWEAARAIVAKAEGKS